MANPTTNFGWVMPTSSDLVTDLPADFAVFGQGVDTTLADLKGGTTGQVLKKASNTDMDFTWSSETGDIEGVTAGTGLTGGGTSGTVTLSLDTSYVISPSIVDAKGDLIAATAADAVSRLAIGTNGQVLTADSTASTGMKWASAATSSFPTFSAYSAADQTGLTSGSWNKVTFGTEDWDTASNFATSTFTPTTAGYYQLTANAFAENSAVGTVQLVVYKNGSRYRRLDIKDNKAAAGETVGGSLLVYANGSTDYFEIYYRGDGGTSTVYSTSELTYFQGIGIRS